MAKILDLERILSKQGFGTRKQCRIMIINEEITVNGTMCDDPDAEFELENLHYTVKGEAWQYKEKSYLMMHKPSNYECSHKTQHHPTIYSLLPHPLVARDVQCIGRLDEDTTGLILISDDGQFIHKMSSPKHKVPKVYEVTCKHHIVEANIHALLEGVRMDHVVELLVEESDNGGWGLGRRCETDEAGVVKAGIAELLHGRDLWPAR